MDNPGLGRRNMCNEPHPLLISADVSGLSFRQREDLVELGFPGIFLRKKNQNPSVKGSTLDRHYTRQKLSKLYHSCCWRPLGIVDGFFQPAVMAVYSLSSVCTLPLFAVVVLLYNLFRVFRNNRARRHTLAKIEARRSMTYIDALPPIVMVLLLHVVMNFVSIRRVFVKDTNWFNVRILIIPVLAVLYVLLHLFVPARRRRSGSDGLEQTNATQGGKDESPGRSRSEEVQVRMRNVSPESTTTSESEADSGVVRNRKKITHKTLRGVLNVVAMDTWPQVPRARPAPRTYYEGTTSSGCC